MARLSDELKKLLNIESSKFSEQIRSKIAALRSHVGMTSDQSYENGAISGTTLHVTTNISTPTCTTVSLGTETITSDTLTSTTLLTGINATFTGAVTGSTLFTGGSALETSGYKLSDGTDLGVALQENIPTLCTACTYCTYCSYCTYCVYCSTTAVNCYNCVQCS